MKKFAIVLLAFIILTLAFTGLYYFLIYNGNESNDFNSQDRQLSIGLQERSTLCRNIGADYVGSFSNGTTYAIRGDEYNYIDSQGREIANVTFSL